MVLATGRPGDLDHRLTVIVDAEHESALSESRRNDLR